MFKCTKHKSRIKHKLLSEGGMHDSYLMYLESRFSMSTLNPIYVAIDPRIDFDEYKIFEYKF